MSPASEWTRVKPGKEISGEPTISFSGKRVSFNSVLWKLAQLDKNRFVVFDLNGPEMKVRFSFLGKKAEDAFTINKTANKNFGRAKAAALLEVPWVKAVTTLEDSKLRRFEAIEVPGNNVWEVTLRPSFDRSADFLEAIPTSAVGIYRYLDDDGDTIYIGKGKVRTQAQQPERKDWEIARYEWSEIPDEPSQFRWERFWIKEYKDRNGKRPKHNKNDGIDPDKKKS